MKKHFLALKDKYLSAFIFLILLFSTAFAQTPLHSLLGGESSAPSVCSDADAQRYIDSTGMSDPTAKAAICQLVISLKDSSLWTSLQAVYPIPGTTISINRWNLKDPQNTNAAFRLCFNAFCDTTTLGTWTFSATGALPGLTGIGETNFNVSTSGTASSTSLSYYSRTNNTGGVEMGSSNTAGTGQYFQAVCRYTDGKAYSGMDGAYASATNADGRGFFTATRTNTTSNTIYRNGVSVATSATSTASNPPNSTIWLQATHQGLGAGTDHSSKECAFAAIGLGLTSTQARQFYNIVQAYETTMGRQL